MHDTNNLLQLILDGKEKMSERSDDVDAKSLEVGEHNKALISWLQKALLEACHAKLTLGENFHENVEPTAYYYTCKLLSTSCITITNSCFAVLNQTIPLVPWKREQSSALTNHTFILLLRKLGLLLPADFGKVFARIPNFWNADHLYSLAEQLGPIETGMFLQ